MSAVTDDWAELRRLADGATGEWTSDDFGELRADGESLVGCSSAGDPWFHEKAAAAYIAAANPDRIRRLLDERDRLRETLRLRPSGHTGADHEVPWFIHGGISHGEGAACYVCALLALPAPDRPAEPVGQRKAVDIPGAAKVLGITEEQIRDLMAAGVLVPLAAEAPDGR